MPPSRLIRFYFTVYFLIHFINSQFLIFRFAYNLTTTQTRIHKTSYKPLVLWKSYHNDNDNTRFFFF